MKAGNAMKPLPVVVKTMITMMTMIKITGETPEVRADKRKPREKKREKER